MNEKKYLIRNNLCDFYLKICTSKTMLISFNNININPDESEIKCEDLVVKSIESVNV